MEGEVGVIRGSRGLDERRIRGEEVLKVRREDEEKVRGAEVGDV